MHSVVRVPLEDAEDEIQELRRRGIYDEDRSVVPDGDHALLPVDEEPRDYEVEEQKEPVLRRRSLDDVVDVEDPPSGWSLVGEVALVRMEGYEDGERRDIAEGVMEVSGASTVLDYRGVAGATREPEVEHVAGDDDTVTTHREHGVSYRLDPTEVMFSTGNQRERLRTQEVVDSGEQVLDMFAGVGYWTLPAAVAGAEVTAIELNPVAADYLREGTVLNDVERTVEVHEGDCREVVEEVEEPEDGFDRVFLGHFDARDHSYLDAALGVVEPGATLHLHDATPESTVERAAEDVEDAAAAHGFRADVSSRRIKSYSEGVVHVVHDVELS